MKRTVVGLTRQANAGRSGTFRIANGVSVRSALKHPPAGGSCPNTSNLDVPLTHSHALACNGLRRDLLRRGPSPALSVRYPCKGKDRGRLSFGRLGSPDSPLKWSGGNCRNGIAQERLIQTRE
jgi:hypothetical protein